MLSYKTGSNQNVHELINNGISIQWSTIQKGTNSDIYKILDESQKNYAM